MRRAIVASFVAGVLIAMLVVFALHASVPEAIAIGLVSGVLGSAVTGVVSLLAVMVTMQGQERRDTSRRVFKE